MAKKQKHSDNKAIESTPLAQSTAPSKPRGGIALPANSQFTFTPGEQVVIVNTNGMMEWGCEFVSRVGKFDTVRHTQAPKAGTKREIERVWLNKLVPVDFAKQLQAEGKAREYGATQTARLERTAPKPLAPQAPATEQVKEEQAS